MVDVQVPYDSLKVFSATKARDREALGETVTRWLRSPEARGLEIAEKVVLQSSDNEFHCLSVTLFLRRAS